MSAFDTRDPEDPASLFGSAEATEAQPDPCAGVQQADDGAWKQFQRARQRLVTRREQLRRKHHRANSDCTSDELTGPEQEVCEADEASLNPLKAKRDEALKKWEAAEKRLAACGKTTEPEDQPPPPSQGQGPSRGQP